MAIFILTGALLTPSLSSLKNTVSNFVSTYSADMRLPAPPSTRNGGQCNAMDNSEEKGINHGTRFDIREMSLMDKLQQFSVRFSLPCKGSLDGDFLTCHSVNSEHSH